MKKHFLEEIIHEANQDENQHMVGEKKEIGQKFITFSHHQNFSQKRASSSFTKIGLKKIGILVWNSQH